MNTWLSPPFSSGRYFFGLVEVASPESCCYLRCWDLDLRMHSRIQHITATLYVALKWWYPDWAFPSFP